MRARNRRRAMATVGALVMLGVVLVAPPAQAVDLRNEDTVEYQVHITRGETTRVVVVRPRQTIRNICTECEISIEEIGVVHAAGPQVATIRNSYLSVDDDD